MSEAVLTTGEMLLRAIAAGSADRAAWAAYADWLRESGHGPAADAAERRRLLVGDTERRAAMALSRIGSPFAAAASNFGHYVLLIGGEWSLGVTGQGLSWDQWCKLWKYAWRFRKQVCDDVRAVATTYRRTIPGLCEPKRKRPKRPEPEPMRLVLDERGRLCRA